MRKPRRAWALLKLTIQNWLADQATSISAALAFYCAFSLAPLMVIAVVALGWIVGAEAADAHVGEQLTALFGQSTSKMIVDAMHAARDTHGLVATLVSIGTLIIGATTIFSALESALEQIWGARNVTPGGWRGFVRTRVISFGFALAIGFLLLVSLTLSTAIADCATGSRIATRVWWRRSVSSSSCCRPRSAPASSLSFIAICRRCVSRGDTCWWVRW